MPVEERRGENVLLGSKREFSLQDALQPRRVSDSMPPAPLFLCSNLDGYQKLFEQYLAEAKSKIDWKKCNPPPEGMVRVCNQNHILQRFVVVPLPSSLAVLFRVPSRCITDARVVCSQAPSLPSRVPNCDKPGGCVSIVKDGCLWVVG